MKVIILLVVIVGISLAVALVYSRSESSTNEMGHKETYTAAVVDFHPLNYEEHQSSQDYMLANAAEYASIIRKAKKLDTDIIVFPEYGLTNIPPYRPDWHSIDFAVEIPPLTEPFETKAQVFTPSQKVLEVLSTAAKENEVYIIVNLVEKVNCSQEIDCPPQQLIYYNSNIVFNRNGCIISRYRKYNLYGEVVTSEKEAHVSTFETDFNVTFGMIICFDIMFGNPALRLITEKGVSDVILSTAWFAELPFLTATGVQSGWAHSMDVNFLASGYRNPETGSGGSGIYNGRKGALAVTQPFTKYTQLLTAKVPIKPSKQRQVKYPQLSYSSVNKSGSSKNELTAPRERILTNSQFFGDLAFKTDPSIQSMSSVLLEPGIDIMLPNNSYHEENRPGFVTSIKVKWRVNGPYEASSPRYRLFSYDGPRPFDVRNESVSAGGVVACANESLDSCGQVPNIHSPIKTTVESVEIYLKCSKLTLGYIPITLDFGLKQLPSSSFVFTKELVRSNQTKMFVIKMNLIKPVDDLFVFAVYRLPA